MRFKPRNRRLLLERVKGADEGKDNPLEGFALPEGIDPTRRGTQIFKVVDLSPDITLSVEVGDLVLVEEAMVYIRNVGDKSFVTVQENYVEGILEIGE